MQIDTTGITDEEKKQLLEELGFCTQLDGPELLKLLKELEVLMDRMQEAIKKAESVGAIIQANTFKDETATKSLAA